MSCEQICLSLLVMLSPWKILQIPFNVNEKDISQSCASLDTELPSLHSETAVFIFRSILKNQEIKICLAANTLGSALNAQDPGSF